MTEPLRAADFDYPLEEELIAQQPLERRDQSKLMRLCRSDGEISHHVFRELPALLRPGDLLVLNDTRVIPARITCRRSSGGRIEGLFLREVGPGRWEVLLKGAGRCRASERLQLLGADETLRLERNLGQGRWEVDVVRDEQRVTGPATELLERVGSPPLPPYIRRGGGGDQAGPADPSKAPSQTARPAPSTDDRVRYQTVYADRPGAVAAPTAGLHFTPELLNELQSVGMELARVTLHVALGTFAPVKHEDLAEHPMHEEWYELAAPTAERLNAARAAGRRIVAVGTTSVRVLESSVGPDGRFASASGWTRIFIYPPARFQAVDALITNFHLPRSTLLMLVAAFCKPGSTEGLPMILRTYEQARRLRYRFYSYGDAMMIE
ncbi:MAG: S-adenosylmethionine:tRNA ribosyltransferase-isomerase [Planctomycetes bacterium ADurb.Bin126]|nr:MAG: S-adenosylmethionine:tRNA ribosyltransferase-isomerase [Planctomycetes bacterium ADurb.Bin126]HOD82993.1 tRNA preQ1(34) S-adenosylmethionine ribosyltransferase-isomerase QueA [Phycisphaerae bacterium]HQL76290.1 tRNA preQ1(34) S-adenosylmethionine ribosyltransferase-isomerase QueA [Phycisphaerae bacterium]